MDGDADPFFIGISVSYFSKETQEFDCLDKMVSLVLSLLVHQKTLYILFGQYLQQIQCG